MKTALAPVALLAAASAIAAHAGDSVVTAAYLPPLPYNVGSSVGFSIQTGMNTKFGESFLATVSGAFDSLRIGNLYHNLTANALQQALQIRLYDVTDTNGLPTGPSIGGWDVPASQIAGNTFPYSPTFQYSGPIINIIAGRNYAFLLGTEIGVSVDFNSPYSVSAVVPGGYADGVELTDHYRALGADPAANAGTDIPFQVNVILPAPAGVAAFGMLAIAGAARRRR